MKTWSITTAWKREPGPDKLGGILSGIVEFRWIEGVGGYQIDYLDSGAELGRSHVHFEGTETFDGFVKWAIGCVQDIDGTYILQKMGVGCPSCGTILNAEAARCTHPWHTANRGSLDHLRDVLTERFPRALKMAHGDEVTAALSLINLSTDLVSAMAPIVGQQIQYILTCLEAAGVDVPSELLKA